MPPKRNLSSTVDKPPEKKRVKRVTKTSPMVFRYPTRPLPPLPQEIWNMIASNVYDHQTLAHLCLVSRAFYVQFTPSLYDTVSLSASSFPKIRKFLRAVQPLMTIAQKFQLSSISDYIGQEEEWPGDVDEKKKPINCSYVHTMRVGAFHPGENHEEVMMLYLKNAIANCENIRTLLWSENALKLSYSVARTILSLKHLAHLKIYLDDEFPSQPTKLLAQLHPLEFLEVSTTYKVEDWHSVSWVPPGLPPERDDTALHTLRGILRTSQKTLKHLVLDDRYAKSIGFRGPKEYANCRVSGMEVARRLFGGMKQKPVEPIFGTDYADSIPWETVVRLEKLETFVLHGFNIDAVALEVLVEAIDLSRLTRLELANGTTGVEKLIGILTTIFRAAGGRLKSLMLEVSNPDLASGPLLEFLLSFQGLEELHIAGHYEGRNPSTFQQSFFQALASHGGTLRSLNLHFEGLPLLTSGIPQMNAEAARQLLVSCPLLEDLAFRPDWDDWPYLRGIFPRFRHLSRLLLRSTPPAQLGHWPESWSADFSGSVDYGPIRPSVLEYPSSTPFSADLLDAYLQDLSSQDVGNFDWDKHYKLRQFGFGTMPLWIPVVKPGRVWEWDWVSGPHRGQGAMMVWEVAGKIIEVRKKGSRKKHISAIGTFEVGGRKVMYKFLKGEKGVLNKEVDEFFRKRYWGWEEWEKTMPEYTP